MPRAKGSTNIRYIYEVEGQFGADGPFRYHACTSKMDAGHRAKDLAEEGARIITVHAARPLPRKLPFGVVHTDEDPKYLGPHFEAITRILNGKWYSKRVQLIRFYHVDDPMPPDIYSQVLAAKVSE